MNVNRNLIKYIFCTSLFFLVGSSLVMTVYGYKRIKSILREEIREEIRIADIEKKKTDAILLFSSYSLGWPTVKPIKGITGTVIDGAHVKIKEYNLNYDFVNDKYLEFINVANASQQGKGASPSSCFFSHEVTPDVFENMQYTWPILRLVEDLYVCSMSPDHAEHEEYRNAAYKKILHEIASWSEERGDKTYFLCGELYMDKTLKAPQKSAFSNATIIACLHFLYRIYHEESLLALAQKYVNALTLDEERLLYVDRSEYLWIEEVIHEDPTQHYGVMNGHIWGILVLFEHYKLTKDPKLLKICKAALLTVERYIPTLRRPGKIINYAVSDLNTIDYTPARIILQLEQLAALSNDEIFLYYADMLKTDQPFLNLGSYDPETELPLTKNDM